MVGIDLLIAIAEQGRKSPSVPPVQDVEEFENYWRRGKIDIRNLNKRDGSCTRRELLLRYLLLDAVLDQGPDTEGVRLLLAKVTNTLYGQDIRFLHKPLQLFTELGIVINHIRDAHGWVKEQRAQEWASINRSNPNRYSLLLDGTRQYLGYAMFRWGVPLAVPHLLMQESASGDEQSIALQRYLASWPSAEIMSQQIKDHPRYGLGKAIGDKAAHLYAKWVVHTFPLLFCSDDTGWNSFSFEVPFDSNTGRVLFRTGFFSDWATLDELTSWNVVQPGKGKDGKDYIRVTNLRGKKSKGALRRRYP